MTNIAEYKDNNDNNEIEWQNKKKIKKTHMHVIK